VDLDPTRLVNLECDLHHRRDSLRGEPVVFAIVSACSARSSTSCARASSC